MLVYKALLDLGFAKAHLIPKHTADSRCPTTAVFLDNKGAAKSAGVLTFLVTYSSTKIVNSVPGDACVANDALRTNVMNPTGIEASGRPASANQCCFTSHTIC